MYWLKGLKGKGKEGGRRAKKKKKGEKWERKGEERGNKKKGELRMVGFLKFSYL